ncbi:MAG: DNA recombination protein RmuC [Endomicrobium sp.]|jgi:DNA recombination protein RmuC|nr:DNA recombination protein RmuC [Endomicrobium sp.]
MHITFILLVVSIILITSLILIILWISLYKAVIKQNTIKKNTTEELINNNIKQFESMKCSFENFASSILEAKSEKILNVNQNSLSNILTPIIIKLDEFKSAIDKYQIHEVEKISNLQVEINNLHKLNLQLSDDANNLANSLKGDNKLQGTWGELSLKRIFESIGLVEGIDYIAQKQFKDDLNEKKIPDYVINLPNKKHIIIDSKTSLNAYSKYYASNNEKEKIFYLKEHYLSIKKHIDELVTKDYVNILELNQAEYVLMFIPIDQAVSIILDNKTDIISYAYKKNIIIVTPSTLLITMKTIEYLRRKELQNKNVAEIVKQSGMLYDKFVTFTEILLEVDNKMLDAQNKLKDSIKRLSSSEKAGDSIISRVQKLKDLGSYTKKNIPNKLL